MRVVVLLVVACGCHVANSAAIDASTLHGDGLPERVITDAALWSDLPIATTPDGASRDGTGGDRGSAGTWDASTDAPDVDAGGICGLLGKTCVGDEGCYPFPFEGTPSGATRCGFQGVGETSAPCQSQLECTGTALCSAPGEPDSVCLRRCDPGNPRCPTGMQCVPYLSYAGIGVCR